MNDGGWLRLDLQICFLLYGASRAVTQLYQPLLAPLGITYPQYLVMLVLWEEGGATMRRLCERLYLDSGTLTPLVKRLEVAGLVARGRSSADERVVDVKLTGAGRRLEREAKSIPEELVCRLGLRAEELQRLHRSLSRLFQTARDRLGDVEERAS
jgi:DNA-binding MarR family transcriptional regulator